MKLCALFFKSQGAVLLALKRLRKFCNLQLEFSQIIPKLFDNVSSINCFDSFVCEYVINCFEIVPTLLRVVSLMFFFISSAIPWSMVPWSRRRIDCTINFESKKVIDSFGSRCILKNLRNFLLLPNLSFLLKEMIGYDDYIETKIIHSCSLS